MKPTRLCILAGWAWACSAACAAGPLLAPLDGPTEAAPAPWLVVGLQQLNKPPTRFTLVTLDGQRVLRVEAQNSYANLVHPVPEGNTAHRLAWRWRLDQAIPQADLTRKDGDDSPVKVCAMFDLPMAAVPFGERQVLRLARLRVGEQLPTATLCYVWDARLPAGTVLDNAFTRRVRMLVLRGPESPQRGWMSEQRDLWADFKRLFGDEADQVPPMLAIAIGADADNTHGHSVAHVASITLD